MSFYPITRLNREQQEYIKNLALRNLSRTPEITVALSRIMAKLVPIPSTPVESVETYYREQGCGVIESVLESLTTLAPFDFMTVKDLSLHFFRYAYDVVHGDCKAFSLGYDNGIAIFFRLNKHFGPETLCLINDKHKEISAAVSQLSEIVQVVMKGNENVAE